MLIHKYRFLETTAKGGDSNPCTAPLYDEVIVAPTKVMVDTSGNVRSVLPSLVSRDNLAAGNGLAGSAIAEERNASTIGAINPVDTGGGGRLEGLFQHPVLQQP